MNDDARQWEPPVWHVHCPPPLGHVTIRELPLRDIVSALSPLTGLLDAARQGASWNLSQAMLETPEQLTAAVAAAANLPVEAVEQLPAGKTVELLQAVIEAHRNFFLGLALLTRIETMAEKAIARATPPGDLG